ncbi:hypothetical protein LD13_gp162 [Bacillus phage Bobb]|uniref:Uncharacterized protein n=1 Tax=Bacillus phage Bobb TaxID=1527469 RepID=A0A076G8Y9_9CAUD|nr:hypothetical protein LD13_gp162 [Bacillus phage Bobb]AII28063.1 hypothetical protein [Bacillus phage Bobb]
MTNNKPREGMLCVSCKTENLVCFDDILQSHYYAEMFKCLDCEGTVCVVYKTPSISDENIKTYSYEAPKGSISK